MAPGSLKAHAEGEGVGVVQINSEAYLNYKKSL